MIQIAPDVTIDDSALRWEFVRSAGPGGQNVNKVATAVQLRLNIGDLKAPDDVRERLRRVAGRQITADGVLLVTARRFRTQERNRQDALEKLIALVQQATEKPKPRKKTKPTRASQLQRLQSKRRRSETKSQRRAGVPRDD